MKAAPFLNLLFLNAGMLLTCGPAAAADEDPKAAVLSAVRKLEEQSGYAWKVQAEPAGQGPSRGILAVPAAGRTERDGYSLASIPLPDGKLEMLSRGGKMALLVEGSWAAPEQLAGRGGESGPALPPGLLGGFKLPAAAARDLIDKLAEFKQGGNGVAASLSAGAAGELLSSGGRGGRGPRPSYKDVKGSAVFRIQDGVLAGFSLEVSGVRESGGNAGPVSRASTIAIDGIGATRVEAPEEAKLIIEALLAGKTPPLFLPEPGFEKLFNGKDLSGWAGSAAHWSVVDGAITGKITAENRASGDAFLFARLEDRNRIADDFELRLSCRISRAGSAGIAYRAREAGGSAAAGYLAPIDGERRQTGGLLDGAAGGRGALAGPGEKADWSAEGRKEPPERLKSGAEVEAAIRQDDWNEISIIASGSRLQHTINGVPVADVVDDDGARRAASGSIALQLRAGEPAAAEFRNIRIRSLSSAAVAAAGNLRVADGFKIELLYTVPREVEGSWVAMCVDPKGRLIVSDQSGKLYRIVPPPIGKSARVQPESIDLEIGGAHGLLYAFDSLYVMVNERGKRGLHRLRDTDGDDRFDEVQLLREIEGGGEHGVHAPVLSPDGKSIYVVCGNSTRLTALDASLVPQRWGEDSLIPRIPTGFMDGSLAPQGWIARTDPDGKKWELVASGFRNEFDAAFNRDGELFTYDADMEWDIGCPWYRPTRVNHVISGGEFGFRNGSGKWPDYSIDSLGSAVDIGTGSPTGIVFGYGARFPARYQEALFICDWSFGKLYAVHLSPQGAGYTGKVEEFLSGQPLPLTDLVIHPQDGSLYFAVGGRRTQSALYRVTYTGSEPTGPAAAAPDAFQEQRQLRRKLESFHGHADPAAIEAVWPHLGDADRAIRYAARIALEWQDAPLWRDRALAEKNPRRAIAALVALARSSGRDSVHRRPEDPAPDPALLGRVLDALAAIDWSPLAHGDRLDLLRAYQLAFIRLGKPDEAQRLRSIQTFDPLFPARSQDLNIHLANLLIYLQAPSAAPRIMAVFRNAPTQEEQIDHALALRALKAGWTLPLREEYFRWFATAAARYRGGNTFAGSLRTIKNEALASLSDAEKIALKPALEASAEAQSPQQILASRKFVKEWTVEALLPLVEAGLKSERDLGRGRKLYGEVACAACHRFGRDGGMTGPDLTGVAGRFGRRDLLEALVEPSRTISDQYAAIAVRKKNGQILTGRIGNLGGNSVELIEDMFDPGRLTGIRRSDIESMQVSKTSIMPEGLLNSLSEEEVLDLIAFLYSGIAEPGRGPR